MKIGVLLSILDRIIKKIEDHICKMHLVCHHKRINSIKLGNAGFLAKAPQAVVDKEKAKADELNTKKAAILERLEYLKTL